jgi:hypothetical protein
MLPVASVVTSIVKVKILHQITFSETIHVLSRFSIIDGNLADQLLQVDNCWHFFRVCGGMWSYSWVEYENEQSWRTGVQHNN